MASIPEEDHLCTGFILEAGASSMVSLSVELYGGREAKFSLRIHATHPVF
jgi:hypothetical protein